MIRLSSRHAPGAAVKRTFDVVVAATALAVLLPFLLLLALLVVVDSPGPVFYRGTRAGFRGRPLLMLKFRKMHADAHGSILTLADDTRLTRVGAWLAASKLDELPQLWHVLRGEMSLVGPRPESLSCVHLYRDDYDVILTVRPGITGYTQLAFAKEGSILDPRDPERHYLTGLLPQKVALDRLYASRPSVRRDLWILVATILTVVFRRALAVDRTTGALTLRRRGPAVESTLRPDIVLEHVIRPAQARPGQRDTALVARPPQCDQVVIAGDAAARKLEHPPDALVGHGAVADEVSGTHVAVELLGREEGERRVERMHIGVDISE